MTNEQRKLTKQMLAILYLKGVQAGALATIDGTITDTTPINPDSALEIADSFITENEQYFNNLMP